MGAEDFNSAVAAAVRAEQAARGWDNNELSARTGISRRTIYRLVETDTPSDRAIPEWKANYLALAAGAFGMSVTDLVAEAERRQGTGRISEGLPQLPTDPRLLLQTLLDNPDMDDELTRRLEQATRHVGDKSVRAQRLAQEIRQLRHAELERALNDLPPTTARVANGE